MATTASSVAAAARGGGGGSMLAAEPAEAAAPFAPPLAAAPPFMAGWRRKAPLPTVVLQQSLAVMEKAVMLGHLDLPQEEKEEGEESLSL